jgi:hypothetical protein
MRNRLQCGSRSIKKILDIINEVFEGILGKIPCPNSIDNWMRKCGLDTYERSTSELSDKAYAQIVDESMMIGGNKLVLTLAAPALHLGRPLTHSDVSVIGIDAAKSFNSAMISDILKDSAQKVGHPPVYVMSDNAPFMLKGIRDAKFRMHADITHTLGLFLEKTYKEYDDFVDFTTRIAQTSRKYNQQSVGYLLPPKLRTIARFINFDNWVRWSAKMLRIYQTFNKEERQIFAFVPHYASLIEELDEVMACIRFIETECKSHGLSKKTTARCMERVGGTLMTGNERMRNLGLRIRNFLSHEVSWIGDDIHNNSTDIIESTFGVLKARKSPNKLYGVTSFVLFMPILGKMDGIKNAQNIKKSLVHVRMRNIKEWEQQKLPPSLVSKRRNRLALAM